MNQEKNTQNTLDTLIQTGKNFVATAAMISIFSLPIGCGNDSKQPTGPVIPPTIEDTESPSKPAISAAPCYDGTKEICLNGTSADNVGVVSYQLFDENSNPIGAPINHATLSAHFIGLTPNTTYHFKAKAKDAAGNESAFSDLATATTDAITPPTPTFSLTADMTNQSFSQQSYDGIATNAAKLIFVPSTMAGTTLENLINSPYSTSCGAIDKDQTVTCTISGIPESNLGQPMTGKLYGLVDFMGDGNLAETGDAVSTGYIADKSTGTATISVDKRLANPGMTSHSGQLYANKSNTLGSSFGDIGLVTIETKELPKQAILDLLANNREITVSEINKGTFIPVAINHATPWDGPFEIQLDDEKFQIVGSGHKPYSPQGPTPREFKTGDMSGRFKLNVPPLMATEYNLN